MNYDDPQEMVVVALGCLVDHECDLSQRPTLALGSSPPSPEDRERVPIEADQVQVDRLASQICDHSPLSSAAAERDCSTVNTL